VVDPPFGCLRYFPRCQGTSNGERPRFGSKKATFGVYVAPLRLNGVMVPQSAPIRVLSGADKVAGAPTRKVSPSSKPPLYIVGGGSLWFQTPIVTFITLRMTVCDRYNSMNLMESGAFRAFLSTRCIRHHGRSPRAHAPPWG